MPKVILKITGAEVELEASETSIGELADKALDICRKASNLGHKEKIGFGGGEEKL